MTSKFTPEIREKIRDRAKWRCERCGNNGPIFQYHHRKPRGMGGSKDRTSGTPANALLLDPACHTYIESNRSESLDNGWLVYQGKDPSATPVRLWIGWALLAVDGTIRRVHSDSTPQVDEVVEMRPVDQRLAP